MEQHRAIPTSRLGRLLHLGRLGSGIAGGVIGEGLRQLGAGRRPRAADLVLTPSNAHRLAERLSEMRGAAMKLGQLLSMDAGDLLPPELAEIFARHAGAHDFGRSDLAARICDAGIALSTDRDLWHTPPADAILLHRKIGGLYLLAARLKARVNVRELGQAVGLVPAVGP